MKKKFLCAILLATLASSIGCKKYLDINTDEDTPQHPDPTSVFPTQLAGIPRGTQYDARYLARYIQNWLTGNNANNNAWDLHGYASGSDAAGDIWRQCYYGLGKNLVYIIEESEKDKRWDVAGAGLALQAMMFQMTTDYHGDIGFYNLFQDDKVFYKYTSQDTVYKGVDSICRKAIDYLGRTLESTGKAPLSRGDFSYNGDVVKWKKFAYGILARNWNHQSNKSTYNADSVIYWCNNSLSDPAGTDDLLIPFSASKNDDANFFGTYRNNMTETVSSVAHPLRQSNFIVRLLDGTTFIGNSLAASRDPRLRHMLSASADTTNGNGGYRGVNPGSGDPNSGNTTGAAARRRVASLWGDSTYGNPSSGAFTTNVGKYLFKDKVVHPVMTYAEIQFIKAEAAMKKGDKTTALEAYRNAVRGHMRAINRDVYPLQNVVLYNTTKITDAEINYYMDASGAIKTTEATLTLTDIMLQKYIALWGWGFVETWCDLRRYHYIADKDPQTGESVYKTFTFPSTFSTTNGGLAAQRFRPRFNSEYVWNIDELARIGALSNNYHTKPMWFSEP
ncbi:SusD/RagB family nutrient-binding outer membrane lipoprotein [Paraflavitalea sp. CAU 1676]|uniref:SusD/RagB family nutrient-binding outer membrane lipoprotein n=1 Tax=Paraflavitalea sp. CAU 1676 TaxID=3032598 RepID=UPI0023DC2358|nr:SusD/RagB family nutrient-binding outer membrane lipoprotein [Paraflavitalea sp. CAU 1676]MDF2192805.1 SusD/RagB family nutrient-binding outer membrane lipoprotein [Paraflavitalea sp. CAU 1676]